MVQDGGYNQPIAAHFTDALNPRVTPRGTTTRPQSPTANTVLCVACQANQEAVVKAMAAFDPTNKVCATDWDTTRHAARV